MRVPCWSFYDLLYVTSKSTDRLLHSPHNLPQNIVFIPSFNSCGHQIKDKYHLPMQLDRKVPSILSDSTEVAGTSSSSYSISEAMIV